MEHLQTHITEILILLFIIVTFVQSGIDKITDWKGNISWLKDHFSGTFMEGIVPLMVATVMILEIITGILAVLGIIWLAAYGNPGFALYALVLAALVLIMLLFGQRVAKDYAGAFTLTGYFTITIIGVYLLS